MSITCVLLKWFLQKYFTTERWLLAGFDKTFRRSHSCLQLAHPASSLSGLHFRIMQSWFFLPLLPKRQSSVQQNPIFNMSPQTHRDDVKHTLSMLFKLCVRPTRKRANIGLNILHKQVCPYQLKRWRYVMLCSQYLNTEYLNKLIGASFVVIICTWIQSVHLFYCLHRSAINSSIILCI